MFKRAMYFSNGIQYSSKIERPCGRCKRLGYDDCIDRPRETRLRQHTQHTQHTQLIRIKAIKLKLKSKSKWRPRLISRSRSKKKLKDKLKAKLKSKPESIKSTKNNTKIISQQTKNKKKRNFIPKSIEFYSDMKLIRDYNRSVISTRKNDFKHIGWILRIETNDEAVESIFFEKTSVNVHDISFSVNNIVLPPTSYDTFLLYSIKCKNILYIYRNYC